MNEASPIRPAPLREIADGEIIEADGIYSMSIEHYHGQCCDGPSISSTGIRKLLRSPAEYWKTSELNPHRVEEGDKEAFILGRAAHFLLLGEAEFDKHFITRPSELDGAPWNGNRIVCRKWLADRKATGITVLTEGQIDQIRGMAGLMPWQKNMTNCGLANTPLVMAGALSGEIERSLIWKEGNVWLKARPDSIPQDGNDFSDLKTTSTGMEDRNLSTVEYERGYHVQGALVGMGAHRVLQRQMAGFHLIFVDTGNVHAVSIRTLDDDDLIRGERAIFVALKIFERCLSTGVWPGPTARQADAQRLSLPAWGREQIDRHLDLLEQEFAN